MWLIVKLLILLTVANGTPILAAKFFGDNFSQPLDSDIVLGDGQPLFGPSKTWRGVVLSLAATSLLAPILGLPWMVGTLIAFAAMIGDLLSSFLKRRLGLFASSRYVGLDQIPESLLPLLVAKLVLPLTWLDVALGTGIFLAGALILSRLLYALNIRDRPY